MLVQRALLAIVPALLAIAALLAVRPALAEGPGRSGSEAKRAKLEERMKRIRHDVLVKRVGLDEQKAKQVELVLDKYSVERQKLRAEQRSQRRALNELLRADSNDQAAYARALKGLREARKKLHALEEREAEELTKLLTAKQQAKYLRALERVRRELRKKFREHRRRD